MGRFSKLQAKDMGRRRPLSDSHALRAPQPDRLRQPLPFIKNISIAEKVKGLIPSSLQKKAPLQASPSTSTSLSTSSSGESSTATNNNTTASTNGSSTHSQPLSFKCSSTQWVLVTAITASTTLFVFLTFSTSSTTSTTITATTPSVKSSSPSPVLSFSSGPLLSSHDPTDLALALSENLGLYNDGDPDQMRACVESLVRVVEGYEEMKKTRRITPELQLKELTPSCKHLSLPQQSQALSHLLVISRYSRILDVTVLGSFQTPLLVLAVLLVPWALWSLCASHLFKSEVRECACVLCRGEYMIQKPIGSGGFATAFTATHGKRLCVVKMIAVDLTRNINEAQNALDEAKRLIGLRHRHVVSYCDVFLHRDCGKGLRIESQNVDNTESNPDSVHPPANKKGVNDFVCIVMEHCNRGSLLDFTETHPLALTAIADMLHQVASGFSHVHNRRCVHRDVKPENIFVVESHNQVVYKIGDFGLALQRQGKNETKESGQAEAETSNHREGAYGTTYFMAPECFAYGETDVSSDVWSLGVTLYEAVVGCSTPHIPSLRASLAQLIPEPTDADCEHTSLCQVALQDTEVWDPVLEAVVARFHMALKDKYNEEYYTRTSASPDKCVGLEDMALTENIISKLPELLKRMLSVDPTQRPTMSMIREEMAQCLRKHDSSSRQSRDSKKGYFQEKQQQQPSPSEQQQQHNPSSSTAPAIQRRPPKGKGKMRD
eukprot:c7149_g1_i1.p1 GENE.c7149_g1_i1~~c7149_g1_i1.p1  ORF type:complete len:719 (-),score=177.58 c7149_g1_i1:191-2347(-)